MNYKDLTPKERMLVDKISAMFDFDWSIHKKEFITALGFVINKYKKYNGK